MTIARHLPHFRAAYRSLVGFAERENLPRAEIDAWQLSRLNEVWRHATQHVPYYRQLRSEARLPRAFDGLEEFFAVVPHLDKDPVREQPANFLSERRGRGRWERTGGSTGSPMNVYWDARAHRLNLLTRYRWQQMWGVDIFDRCAFLWGHAASFAGGYKGRLQTARRVLEDHLRNRLRLSAYRLGSDDLAGYIGRLEEFGPVSLYGYSSAVLLLARRARDLSVKLPSLKVVMVTGEPAPGDLLEEVEDALGVPAIVEYGSVECGNIAVEWPDRQLHVREDNLIVETHPGADGREEIVVSVLNNLAFPLLRYRIGDIASGPLRRPVRGFALLPGVEGRNNDCIASATGRLVHSMTLKHVMEQCAGVRRFHVAQDESGSLQVLLERDSPQRTIDTTTTEQQLLEILEGYGVSIEVVDNIPGTSAGKHRWIVSEMTNQVV